ncbi:MAG: hypothetical protein AAGI11_06550 [Pseudomonadota bacterium]
MEKMIYLLKRSAELSPDAFSAKLFGAVVDDLRELGASRMTINIADLNETIQAQAPGRLMGPWQDVAAVVSFWQASLDERGPIEDCLSDISDTITGYLVTESIVQPFDQDWQDGERRPGITQFGANGKPADVSDEDFYHNWQVLHSAQSFDLHPLRWSYVRNAVARPLTPGAPTYRAIVSEHFYSLEDFTDDARYFGSQQALEEMIEHMPGFCDLGNMFSLGMSEYHFS